MYPGNPSRLTCPHCGKSKYILSILSGNTCSGTFWSDTSSKYPMLPETSSIQKCNHCGHLFFFEDSHPVDAFVQNGSPSNADIDKTKIWDEARENEYGELSFEEANDAYDEMYNDTLPNDRRMCILFTWLFAYNDKYAKKESQQQEKPDATIKERHEKIIRMIIDEQDDNILFIAELHRELGEFDKSIEMLNPLPPGSDFQIESAKKILEHARNHDSSVFILADW